MARHNRDGAGEDQRDYEYTVRYQPDWLRHVKVSRQLETGRQSTKTLFRNPADRQEAEPGKKVRTRITCPEQDLDFEIAITDPAHRVVRVRVACVVPADDQPRGVEEVEFTLEDALPPPSQD